VPAVEKHYCMLIFIPFLKVVFIDVSAFFEKGRDEPVY
jgi:hypothetical protein